MSCSVNLVPVPRRLARQRAVRQRRWVVVGLAAGLIVATGWGVQQMAERALDGLSVRVTQADAQRKRARQSLATADQRRTALLARLEAVAAARRPQPWAQRLVTLSQEAPEAVLLTEVRVGVPGLQSLAARGGRPAAGGQRRDADEETGDAPSRAQPVRVLGYALDHGALLQFVNTLQGLEGWQQVELVRATLGPFRTGQAIAFELDCRTQEAVQ
jgi:hypothetical protein